MNPRPDSRQAILDRLRSMPVDTAPLPDVDPTRLVQFDDPIAKFAEMLETVGGQLHHVDGPEQIGQKLDSIKEFSTARQIVSMVPEAVVGNVDPAEIHDPHALSSLDWVIARGEFMVAENGAIWIDGNTLPHRVLLFITQYLAIVVSKSQVVHNLHEAYQRIGNPRPTFGIFVAGPSKTADIEQSLVLGAHGCRALQVFLIP